MKKALIIFAVFVGLLACVLCVVIPTSEFLSGDTSTDTTVDTPNPDININPTPSPQPDNNVEHIGTTSLMGELQPLLNNKSESDQTEFNPVIGKTISLTNQLDVIYYLSADALADYSYVYLTIEKPDVNDNGESTKVRWVYYDRIILINNQHAMKFVYSDLTTMEMSVEFKVTINADGASQPLYEEYFSVAEYAYKQLAKPDLDQELRTLLVDMLNYGTEMQTYFGYNTENLANAFLTEEQKTYATAEIPKISSTKKIIEGEDDTINYIGATLDFEYYISMNLYFDFGDYLPENIGVLLKSNDVHENECLEIEGDEFEYREDVDKYVAQITLRYASEMDMEYTFSFYDMNTELPIGDVVTYSIEAYIDSALKKTSDESLRSLLTSMLKYGNSAKNYKNNSTIVEHKLVEVEGKNPTCTEIGWYPYITCTGCSYSTYYEIPATGHWVIFPTADYVGMSYCENEGCSYAEELLTYRSYDHLYEYTFTAQDKEEIESNLQIYVDRIEYVGEYNNLYHQFDADSELYQQYWDMVAIYNQFRRGVSNVYSQYQHAYLAYYMDMTSENAQNYLEISNYYSEKLVDYYAFYRLVYESAFREYFADDVGANNVDYYLYLADTYGQEGSTDLSKRLNDIEVEYNEIDNPQTSDLVPVLYDEFVNLNNQLAKMCGYDNYLEYAYYEEYSRNYNPEDAKAMRSYVKEYISDIYAYTMSQFESTSLYGVSSESMSIYNALTDSIFFDSPIARNLVYDYLTEMSAYSSDFYYVANTLFADGHYFRGEKDGAFSWSIDNVPILYFGPGTYYSGTFTFIHEYGHYYNTNLALSVGMDVAEVHSQGNEMMFLAFLENRLSDNVVEDIYTRLYYSRLSDMLKTVLLASAVDEFEYCVYTSTAPDGTYAEYDADDYDQLFSSILELYGLAEKANPAYWRLVTITSAGYYISYAMSALPSVEILSIAGDKGFETARDVYFNTHDGYIYDYSEWLYDNGLHSVFEEDLYSMLFEYFVNTEKKFGSQF